MTHNMTANIVELIILSAALIVVLSLACLSGTC